MPHVTVTCDCNAKTFDVKPPTVPVPANASVILNWKVVATHPNPGNSVRFTAAGGIIFKPNSNWPGGTPVVDANDATVYTATDNNIASSAGDFFYSINILLLDGNGGSTPYTFDPDIDNQGTPIKMARVSRQ